MLTISKFIKLRKKKAGLPPGTPVFIGEKKVEEVKVSVIDYDESQLTEKELESIEECFPLKDTSTVSWINISGIHDIDVAEKIGKNFGIHPLVLEDIVNTEQRPKMEDHGEYIYTVLKMLSVDQEAREIKVEQVSIILSANVVVTFQEEEGDIFQFVRERIRNHKGRIRKMGTDYLAYSLIDAIVDNYFTILDNISEKIDGLEEGLLTNPQPELLQNLHQLKREMIFLRKSLGPLREVINSLQRGDSPLIHEASQIYYRDVYDHVIQVIDSIETMRDMISGMLDTYLSSISYTMNEVMKVLTIIATIFIPLTFIAGIYGMNFEFMPELGWRWAYFGVWGVIAAVATFMIGFFKRKKWF